MSEDKTPCLLLATIRARKTKAAPSLFTPRPLPPPLMNCVSGRDQQPYPSRGNIMGTSVSAIISCPYCLPYTWMAEETDECLVLVLTSASGWSGCITQGNPARREYFIRTLVRLRTIKHRICLCKTLAVAIRLEIMRLVHALSHTANQLLDRFFLVRGNTLVHCGEDHCCSNLRRDATNIVHIRDDITPRDSIIVDARRQRLWSR